MPQPTCTGTVLAALLVGALCACQAKPTVGAAPVIEPAAAVQQAPAVVTPPVPRTYSASMATFRGDQLDECIELDITPAPGQEPAALKMVNDFMTEGKDGAVQKLSIAKRCPEQFPDRTVLATCSMVDRPGTAGKVTIRDRYYSADTARDSDGYMKDCLSAHGDWQPNTDKWAVHHERVRGQMKQMQKIAQDLESEAR